MDIYVDGSYCSDDRTAGLGVYANPHINISKTVKATCSLTAEYLAVIEGCTIANRGDTIYTDCAVIVEALKTRRYVKNHTKYCSKVYALVQEKKLYIRWIKREKNTKADELSRAGRKATKC